MHQEAWTVREGEGLQIGAVSVRVAVTGQGKGRRLVLVASAPTGTPIKFVPRTTAATADNNHD